MKKLARAKKKEKKFPSGSFTTAAPIAAPAARGAFPKGRVAELAWSLTWRNLRRTIRVACEQVVVLTVFLVCAQGQPGKSLPCRRCRPKDGNDTYFRVRFEDRPASGS